jgi:hypothetical protein
MQGLRGGAVVGTLWLVFPQRYAERAPAASRRGSAEVGTTDVMTGDDGRIAGE